MMQMTGELQKQKVPILCWLSAKFVSPKLKRGYSMAPGFLHFYTSLIIQSSELNRKQWDRFVLPIKYFRQWDILDMTRSLEHQQWREVNGLTFHTLSFFNFCLHPSINCPNPAREIYHVLPVEVNVHLHTHLSCVVFLSQRLFELTRCILFCE